LAEAAFEVCFLAVETDSREDVLGAILGVGGRRDKTRRRG